MRLVDEVVLHLLPTTTPRPRPSTGRRARLSAGWKRRIAAVWPRCSESRTEPNASHAVSFAVAAPGSDNVIEVAERVACAVVKQIQRRERECRRLAACASGRLGARYLTEHSRVPGPARLSPWWEAQFWPCGESLFHGHLLAGRPRIRGCRSPPRSNTRLLSDPGRTCSFLRTTTGAWFGCRRTDELETSGSVNQSVRRVMA